MLVESVETTVQGYIDIGLESVREKLNEVVKSSNDASDLVSGSKSELLEDEPMNDASAEQPEAKQKLSKMNH